MNSVLLYVLFYTQIILESLPVSSSGHVALLVRYWDMLYLQDIGPMPFWIIDFLLHIPTIAILVLFFCKQWWNTFLGIPFYRFYYQQKFWVTLLKMAAFVGIVDGITFLSWSLHIVPSIPLTVGFIVTAIALLSLKYCADGKNVIEWNYKHAVILGIVQTMSLMPGISRFATTYAAGCWFGNKRQDAFALSFLIQFPLLLGAACKGLLALRCYSESIKSLFDLQLLFVILSASCISYLLLYGMYVLVRRKQLWYISWYMAVPILLSILL